MAKPSSSPCSVRNRKCGLARAAHSGRAVSQDRSVDPWRLGELTVARQYEDMATVQFALLLAIVTSCSAQDAIERERKAYDEIYGSQPETFSALPNAFLMRVISGRTPGKALDVGMGQGRNAIWLAENGWAVSGFDISPVGIEHALREAERRKLRIEAFVTPYERFDWGKGKWDLIVFSYFFPQSALRLVWESLKPGGLILVEGFHSDTARVRPIGGGYTDKQMFETLQAYRILIYEDVEAKQEWGRQYGQTNRLVRILAQKPSASIPGCSWKGRDYRADESMCWGVAKWTCGPQGWQHSGKCSESK